MVKGVISFTIRHIRKGGSYLTLEPTMVTNSLPEENPR